MRPGFGQEIWYRYRKNRREQRAVQYDATTKTLTAFSRNRQLNEKRLSGFWNYVQGLCAEEYKDTPDYVIFGEWLT